MARSSVAPPELVRRAGSDRKPWSHHSTGRPASVKLWLLGTVLLSLVCLFAFGLSREVSTGSPPAGSRPIVPTARPALSADEEAYARALWPIHNNVKASALRMTLGGIQYKTQGLEPAVLQAQIAAARETYAQSESQIRALRPPPSMQQLHNDYLGAVLLYQESAAEMIKVVDDGQDDHLKAAFPLSQQGGQTLRQVGSLLWPGEYVPN